eukprot:365376-Chlamydomonas_euryale.AAC.7
MDSLVEARSHCRELDFTGCACDFIMCARLTSNAGATPFRPHPPRRRPSPPHPPEPGRITPGAYHTGRSSSSSSSGSSIAPSMHGEPLA